MNSREEAAVKAWDHYWGDRYGDEAMDEMGEEVAVALAAADAHDAAHGVHRVTVDHETTSRAAQVVHNFLNANYPCGCGVDEMCPGNSDEAYTLARAVLAAAVGGDGE